MNTPLSPRAAAASRPNPRPELRIGGRFGADGIHRCGLDGKVSVMAGDEEASDEEADGVGVGDEEVGVGVGDEEVGVGVDDGEGDLVVLVGEGDGLVGVGLGMDGFGDADFRADGLADGVVTTAGTTIAWEDTRLEGDGEADLTEAVCSAEVGAVGEGAGTAGWP